MEPAIKCPACGYLVDPEINECMQCGWTPDRIKNALLEAEENDE